MKKNLESVSDEFIAAILESEVYQKYRAELAIVKQEPGLKEQIDNFRKRNHEFQSSPDIDFARLDRFEKEYEDFREKPLVADFLAAELDLIRMIQRIYTRIVAALDFE